MKTSKPVVALALIAVLGTGVGCARVRSKAAMKDGNKDYKEENFKKAVDDYERATRLDPNFSEAWFYLGSSHQAQYRPGKDTPRTRSSSKTRSRPSRSRWRPTPARPTPRRT
jgi:tetratricopeptide (TPR) repeat protein